MGEQPEVRLEDWLLSLERTAKWNEWTQEDQLIQLAGHLKAALSLSGTSSGR